jgi:hypothetical protein
MNFALGLFVLSLLGADESAKDVGRDHAFRKVTVVGLGGQNLAGCDAPAITYDVRMLKTNGLEWRGAFYAQLQPVTSQMGGSVWTASRETAERLAELDPQALKAPRITAASQGVAHLSDRGNRKVASGLARLADGPFDHATQVAYTPRFEEIRDGMALTMTGRKLDQGVLVCVVLDESRVAAVHQVALSETVSARACCATDLPPAGGKIASRIEVPEVVHASLAGEWLVPNDGVLVLSLGVQTTADPAGKAVVTERLVLIEAAVAGDAGAQASLVPPLPDAPSKLDGPPTADRAMSMPAIPSLSLPQALNAEGVPMPLPPLPEDVAPPTLLPGSSEPCASPQGVNRKAPDATTLDTGSTRAGFTPAAKGKAAGETGDSSRPYLLRFPVNAGGMNMQVEIRMASPAALFEKLRPAAPTR